MSNVKKMVLTALMIALGIVLPMTMPAIPEARSVLLPMHFSVLLCGIVCGIPYGAACGIMTPLLSHLITSMPPAAILPSMVCELAVYGIAAAVLIHLIRTKNTYVKIYLSLIGAMLIGRIVFGVLNALIFSAGSYSMRAWLTASFVTALPGIAIQLVLIPVIVITLRKAKLITIQ
jgi:niacin transporter